MSDGRRVLVTGVARFLGLRLAGHLAGTGRVDHLVGVDLDAPPITIPDLEFVRADIRNPLIARIIDATGVDTIVHTNISSSPRLLGGRSEMKENNVIGTKKLLAAAQRSKRVRKVVMKSSTAVYGSGPGEPSIVPEDHAAHPADLSGYGKDCAEAETYARDFGRRRPDVDLIILRTQNVIGPTVRTSMCDYLSLPVMPTALGFDPRLQFLHETDAVTALTTTIESDCRGIFNIAADGIVYLSQAIRLLGRMQMPMPLFVAEGTATLLRRLNVVDFPPDQLRVMIYGRVVETRRARETLGFSPQFTSMEALRDFRNHRNPDLAPEPSSHPAWERELVEYLRHATAGRRTVS